MPLTNDDNRKVVETQQERTAKLSQDILRNMLVDDLRGGQRLAYILLKLMAGETIKTAEMSVELGVTRQNVYRMLDELSGMHVPVVNFPAGNWVLESFIHPDDISALPRTTIPQEIETDDELEKDRAG